MTNLSRQGATAAGAGVTHPPRQRLRGLTACAQASTRGLRPPRPRLLQALVCCALLLITLPGPALAELRIASWNIQHFGWGQQKSLPAVARVVAKFDVVAIQELMNAEALYELQQALEADTGEPWQILYSEPLGSGTYREKYAFIWRSNAVEYVDGAVLYIADRDRFAREPYSARFRATDSNLTFVLATVHVVYGRRVSDRTPEVKALRGYWEWLAEVYPEDAGRRLLLGDFNLRPSHAAWAELTEVAEPLILEGATTLSSNDRRYANLYDNVFVPREHELPITGAGIYRFPERLSETTGRYWSHEKARRHVSDHAPVYVLLAGATPYAMRSGWVRLPAELEQSGWFDSDSVSAVTEPVSAMPHTVPQRDCVDLNTATLADLQRVIHIGPRRAMQVVDSRPWEDVDSLIRVQGINESRLREIREQGSVCEQSRREVTD